MADTTPTYGLTRQVRLLDQAMDGLGSNKEALVEFLCGRSPARVRAAKKAYEDKHDSSLIDRFNDELDGSFQTVALQMLKGKRKVDEKAEMVDDKVSVKVEKAWREAYKNNANANQVDEKENSQKVDVKVEKVDGKVDGKATKVDEKEKTFCVWMFMDDESKDRLERKGLEDGVTPYDKVTAELELIKNEGANKKAVAEYVKKGDKMDIGMMAEKSNEEETEEQNKEFECQPCTEGLDNLSNLQCHGFLGWGHRWRQREVR